VRGAPLVLAVCVACGGSTGAPLQHPAKPAGRAALDKFLGDEERVLVLLAAADPRVAARGVVVDEDALHHAAMGGILAEDPTLAMEGNRPDVLSFDVRDHALQMASKIMAGWVAPPTDPDPASALRPEIELELLHRLVAEETLRLANERAVPRSASTLLGGLAATWRTPAKKDVSFKDDWLSRRLGEMEAALGPQSLTLLERNELDDALDPIERVMADGLPKSRQALVRLRLAVEGVETATRGADRWHAVGEQLQADTGTVLSADTLLSLLQTEAKQLATDVAELVVKVTEEAATRAGELLVGPLETCHTTTPSRIRSLEPPPERLFDCSLRARLIAAHTADEVLGVLLELHDAVVAAAWAVVLARGGDDTAIALAAPRPLSPMTPTIEGKLKRFAATHPVEAVARALSIEWVMRNGLGEAALRAEAWRAFGDAPIDVIDREVHPQKRKSESTVKTPGWKD
jgi:hypothetical protein